MRIHFKIPESKSTPPINPMTIAKTQMTRIVFNVTPGGNFSQYHVNIRMASSEMTHVMLPILNWRRIMLLSLRWWEKILILYPLPGPRYFAQFKTV